MDLLDGKRHHIAKEKSGCLDVLMSSRYNCCVPGCTNSLRNAAHLHFYRIPKDEPSPAFCHIVYEPAVHLINP